MNDTDEPRLGEVVRRLDEIVKRMDRESQERREQMDMFVLKETFAEIKRGMDDRHRSLAKQVDDIVKQREADETWHKNMNLTVTIAILSGLVTITLGIITLVRR